MRAALRSANTRTPVPAASRPAASNPGARSVAPPNSNPVGSPDSQDGSRSTDALRPWIGAGRWRRGLRRLAGCVNFTPGKISRYDERSHLPGRLTRSLNHRGSIGAHVSGPLHRPNPARHRTSEGFDIGRQGRVVAQMLRAVLPNDIHHRRPRLPGVVKIGQRIAQTGTQVQQCGGRAPAHPRVAVSGARAHSLEQAEHAAHSLHAIERRYKLHLRRAGIHEARVHSAVEQGSQKTFRSVHTCLNMRSQLLRFLFRCFFKRLNQSIPGTSASTR